MCTNPYFALQLKEIYDVKFQRFGVHSPIKIIGSALTKDYNVVKNELDDHYNLILVPCGQCIDCRIKKVRDRTCQGLAEFATNQKAVFITLTFGSVATYKTVKKMYKLSSYKARKYTRFLEWSLETYEFQKFMKRLRFWFYNKQLRELLLRKGYFELSQKKRIILSSELKEKLKDDISNFKKIRFMHCGEYGTLLSRPHHHAIIYGIDLSDLDCYEKMIYDSSERRYKKRYISRVLEQKWTFGFNTVDVCNSGSIGYVARYITKKINGDTAEEHYNGKHKEYITSSNRVALGTDYYIKNKEELLTTGYCCFSTSKGKKIRFFLPSSFDRWLKKNDISSYLQMKNDRSLRSVENFNKLVDSDVSIYSYLDMKEKKRLQQFNKFVRNYERGYYEYNEFYAKAHAFGFSNNFIEQFKTNVSNNILFKDYRSYLKKSTNKEIFEKYRHFEQGRNNLINYYSTNVKLNKNFIDIMVKNIKEWVNPFKVKERSKKTLPFELTKDDNYAIDVNGKEFFYENIV